MSANFQDNQECCNNKEVITLHRNKGNNVEHNFLLWNHISKKIQYSKKDLIYLYLSMFLFIFSNSNFPHREIVSYIFKINISYLTRARKYTRQIFAFTFFKTGLAISNLYFIFPASFYVEPFPSGSYRQSCIFNSISRVISKYLTANNCNYNLWAMYHDIPQSP